ncbi:hypothetical protein FO519_006902 [Halicephalobus sp. NKZ332]|nr:hypothetical protein FO519_006902 [Halicephalobus sp. NKZ332]
MIGIIALVFKSRMANTNTDITSETMNTDLKMVDMDSKIMDMDPKVVDMNSKTMDTDSKKTGSTTISSVGHSNLHCVIYNYWESNKEYSEGPHITLLLHATSNYLFYLEEQLKTWTGGISVSVFIPTPVNQQTEFSNILKSRFHEKNF